MPRDYKRVLAEQAEQEQAAVRVARLKTVGLSSLAAAAARAGSAPSPRCGRAATARRVAGRAASMLTAAAGPAVEAGHLVEQLRLGRLKHRVGEPARSQDDRARRRTAQARRAAARSTYASLERPQRVQSLDLDRAFQAPTRPARAAARSAPSSIPSGRFGQLEQPLRAAESSASRLSASAEVLAHLARRSPGASEQPAPRCASSQMIAQAAAS